MVKRPDRSAETIKFQAQEVLDFARAERRFATLVVIQGADADIGSHILCDRPVVIGRDQANELPLADGSTSRRHCQVERMTDGTAYLLRDLGSTNGTLLNGRRIEAETLKEGDKIFVGASVIKFGWADAFEVDYQSRVDALVGTDELTGLLSKRRFDGDYKTAVNAARSTGRPLSVLVMDMDGLKKINDTYGHAVGGQAIKEVAGSLRLVLEARGSTCRFGGDEFISFLPDCEKPQAVELGQKIRDRVAAHSVDWEGVRVAPTISIGVATFPEDGDTPETLFRRADEALYRAKAGGRNQVAT
jgi:diguanylate cyclase (GGDEF)-like protein